MRRQAFLGPRTPQVQRVARTRHQTPDLVALGYVKGEGSEDGMAWVIVGVKWHG